MLFKIEMADAPYVSREKDPASSGLEDMEDSVLVRRIKKRRAEVIDRISEIGMPQAGEQLRIITRRKFNAIEFVDFIAKTERITRLNAAIYSINYFAAMHLLELIDNGTIAQCEIMMSNLRNGAHREKERIVVELFSGHPKIDLWFSSSHAKLMAIETDAGNCYLIEGSGNHAENSRIEQYVIDNDREMIEFTQCWMREMREFLQKKENEKNGKRN